MSRGELVVTARRARCFSQRELMKSIHLGVPQAAELAIVARKGFDLPEGCIPARLPTRCSPSPEGNA